MGSHGEGTGTGKLSCLHCGCGGYIPHQQNLQTTKTGLERAQRLKVPQTPKFQPDTHMPNTGKQRQEIHWGFLAAGLTGKTGALGSRR